MKIKLIFSIFMLTAIGSLLKGQEFATQNLLSNLNNYSNGFGAFANHTSLNVPTGYGTLLGLRFWDGDGSDWRTQLAFGTDNNFYYRQSTNTNGASWTNWYKVYHSGNINRSDVDLNAKTIYTNSSWNSPAIQFGGGSYLRSNGTYVVLQQNGPDADKTFYIEGFSNILKDQNVVYHAGNLNRLDVGFSAYHLTTTRQGIGIEGSGYGNSWGIGKDNTMGLYFYEGTVNQYRMIIKDGGNVLIGKTFQTGTGTRYKLDVEGPVRAHEIVVNTTGADFVFDPTYKLRSLSELETFILKNKHLPDFAPAKEMQENGVSAGEMQAKLLQKVEELTLYVIEKDKEISDLKTEKDKQIADLKTMLMEMKKEIEILKTR